MFTMAPAEEEDEGALLDEALGCGAADAGSAAGDHGGLSIQSGHDVHPSLELFESNLQRADIPPSTLMIPPVIHFPRSDASNATTSATSSGAP